jgi:hypothetical protein
VARRDDADYGYLRKEVATNEVRKASRARAPDSPVPGEGRSPNGPARRRTADENGECVLSVFGDGGEGVTVHDYYERCRNTRDERSAQVGMSIETK